MCGVRTGCGARSIKPSEGSRWSGGRGSMRIQWEEGEIPRCGAAVRRGAEDNTAAPGSGGSARRLLTQSVEQQEEEIAWAARHTCAEREGTRKVFGLGAAVSCGSREPSRRGTELDLSRRKSLADQHRPTTVGTEPKRTGLIGSGCFRFGLRPDRAERLQAKRQ